LGGNEIMKKGLSCIIIGFLLITIIPIENDQALSTSQSLTGDIYIESIHPIQVIEDADTLVTNKATVVRLIVQSTFPDEVRADIEITYDFGTKTLIEDGGGSTGVKFAPGTNKIYVPGGPAIPAHSLPWHPGDFLRWTNTGFDSLIKAKLDPDDSLEETDETNNEITSGAIRVANAPQLRVLYLPIAFPGDEDWEVPSHIMRNQREFMVDIFPLAESDLVFQPGPLWRFSITPSGTGIARKNWIYEVVAYPIACTARIMGFHRVIICDEGYAGGCAIGMIKKPQLREPVILTPYSGYTDLVAHELGHTYYLWHPFDIGPPVYTSKRFDVKDQEYNRTMDVFMDYSDGSTWIDKGRYDHNPKILISEGCYSWNLMDQLTEDPPTYSCIMVHGILRDDGTITLNHSWYTIEAIPDVPQQIIKGSQNEDYYFIMFLNENQQIISQFPFVASFNYITHDDKTEQLKNAVTDALPFVFNIPEVEGTRLIQIQDADGQVLAEREVTLNSPNVQVTHPNGGEEFKIGDKINIEWNAQDQDQDTLRYTLAFSNDSGENWIPMAFDIKETSFEWNTFDQSEGEYLIKVIASDGVNIGEDISDGGFSLPRTKVKTYPLVIRILERLISQFPLLEQILSYLKL
jgi:hypothetical protein